MPVSFEKIEKQAPGLVSLAKTAQVSLEKAQLNGHTAKVALVLDCSGSMSQLYRTGVVQRAAERVLALATRFDDDGDIQVFGFGGKAEYLGDLNLGNYQGGVDKLGAGADQGGTDYGKAIDAVVKYYGFGGKKKLFGKKGDKTTPVYVLFLTDGDDTGGGAERAIKDASGHPVFWQFVGLGREHFATLTRLDDMPGRVTDNADFFGTQNLDGIPDEDLFGKMLDEYPDWVVEAKRLGILS